MVRLKGKLTVTKKTSSSKLKGVVAEEPLERIFTLEWHFYIALGVFLSVYVKCTSASIPSGDAGDFIMASHHFGVAHPPGYPLYVTLGYIWMKLLPFGSPAFKLNLLTSMIGGLAATIVYITTYKITNFIPSAVFASTVFGFSHLVWFHSVGAEIFSLNNLFCALLLYWVVRFQRAAVTNRARVAMEASFLSGLSMCNQHTSVLFISVVGSWMFISLLRDKAITAKQFACTGAIFTLALLPYIQLPLSAYFAGAPNTWGDHRTLSGIWKHFVREEYGTFRLQAQDGLSSDFLGNLRMYTRDVIKELGILTLLLCAACLTTVWHFSHIKTIVYVYAANIGVYILFFCNQANVDLSAKEFNKGVLERFWMQANIPVSILAGCGMWCLYSFIAERWKVEKLHYLLGLVALLVGTHQIRRNLTSCELNNNFIMRDFGRNMLDAVPRNGVLLVQGDMPSIITSYLRYSENYRPDVDVVDQELIGFNWYKSMIGPRFNHYIFPYDREVYFKEIQIRREEKEPFSYNFLDVFDVHRMAGVALYVYPLEMREGDESWTEIYEIVPTSMVFEVRHKEDSYSIEEFLDIADQRLKFDTSHINCDSSLYPVRSWEHLIADKCGAQAFLPAIYAQVKFTEDETAYIKPHNRLLMIKIFNFYRHACDTMTVILEDGTTKMLFKPDHNNYYGIMAYLLYQNYLSTEEFAEAGKYARVMNYQLETYMRRNDEGKDVKEDYKDIKSVLAGAMKQFPDLETNKDYDMVKLGI
ncbi:protein O-mannosyl-transferase TMEM260-like [Bolinopsis microptera]|uniref:protein O-mannosyl-transferase TMEM260-like n=1 Tax=Bolinopsis microptera TaxID=2820187 RepID=UPI00307ABA74